MKSVGFHTNSAELPVVSYQVTKPVYYDGNGFI